MWTLSDSRKIVNDAAEDRNIAEYKIYAHFNQLKDKEIWKNPKYYRDDKDLSYLIGVTFEEFLRVSFDYTPKWFESMTWHDEMTINGIKGYDLLKTYGRDCMTTLRSYEEPERNAIIKVAEETRAMGRVVKSFRPIIKRLYPERVGTRVGGKEPSVELKKLRATKEKQKSQLSAKDKEIERLNKLVEALRKDLKEMTKDRDYYKKYYDSDGKIAKNTKHFPYHSRN